MPCREHCSEQASEGSNTLNGIELAMTEFDATVRKWGIQWGSSSSPGRGTEKRARVRDPDRDPGKIDWSKIWGRLEAKEAIDQMIRWWWD